jgi:Tfp pilus assembly protein PilF
LGTAQTWLGQHTAAIDSYRHALALDPNLADACDNLGTLLLEQGQANEAIDHFRRAIQLQPQFVEAWFNLGNAWRKLERFEQAIQCYQRAIALRPGYGKANANLGIAHAELLDFAPAIPAYQQAIAFEQETAEVHNNLGVALAQQQRIPEAMACVDRAIQLDPTLADAHMNRSVLWLLTGDTTRGWPEFEWRWLLKALPDRNFTEPRWQGEPLTGKTILLHAEQGFGDTFQFIRYAPLVKQYGGCVLFECQRGLMNLLQRCQGIDQLVAHGDPLPPFDVQSPLMSLPGALGTTVATIPADVPYIYADPKLCEHWRQKLDPIQDLRIAINWQGRPGRGPYRLRDIPFEYFANLSKMPGVRLISLQKNHGQMQAERSAVFDLGNEFDQTHGAFSDSAAILMNVDLVITSDTAVAHLAGALGVPTFLALPFAADWRWFLNRADSPWYPTMRLFRQPRPGDWSSVFAQIETALHEFKSI